MRIPLSVEYVDGTTEEVEATLADMIGFERTWNRTMMKFQEEMRLTDLVWLAWSALTHRGLCRLKFDVWVDTVEMVTSVEKDAVVLTDAELLQDALAKDGENPLSPVTDQHTG